MMDWKKSSLKSSWNDIVTKIPGLKSYWAQMNLITIDNGVLTGVVKNKDDTV